MKHSEMHHQYGRPKKCSLLINNKNIYQEVILQNEKKSYFAKKKKKINEVRMIIRNNLMGKYYLTTILLNLISMLLSCTLKMLCFMTRPSIIKML